MDEYQREGGEDDVLQSRFQAVPLTGLPHREPLATDGDEAEAEEQHHHQQSRAGQPPGPGPVPAAPKSQEHLPGAVPEHQRGERLPDDHADVAEVLQRVVLDGPPHDVVVVERGVHLQDMLHKLLIGPEVGDVPERDQRHVQGHDRGEDRRDAGEAPQSFDERPASPRVPVATHQYPAPVSPVQAYPVGGSGPRSTIAATGPPPSGPWCAADTETNTAGSPVTEAATPPTQLLIWRCQCTSESSSIALRRPRTVPSWLTSHLRKTFTRRPPRSVQCGRAGRSSRASWMAAQMPSVSRASRMTECPIRYRPPTPRTFPTTTTWAWSSSTPDEHDATVEYRPRSLMTWASEGISISPRATATPRPVQPLDRSIDSWGCSVHTV